MDINIAVDPEGAFGRAMTELEKKQLPFAVSVALNRTAKRVVLNWQKAIAGTVMNPTPFTRNAPMMKVSTKSALTAEVFLRDQATGGRPPAKYMQELFTGGTRRDKGFENVLQRLGVLPAGMVAVPGKGASVNAYGNHSRGQLKNILDAFDPSATGSRALFAVSKPDKGLRPGIYRRVGRKGRKARPLVVFIRRPSYQKRLDLARVADVTVARHYMGEFERALEDAVTSAIARAAGK